MFVKSFYVFVILCGYVNSALNNQSIFIKNFSTDIQTKQQKISKFKLFKTTPALKNGATRTKRIIKRGIVMVDNDFDIPSKIYAYENDLDTGDISEKNEGSGYDDYSEEIFKYTEVAITPISELQKVTNISTASTQSVTTVSTQSVTTVSTQSTTKATKPTTENIIIWTSANPEGSGDDNVSEVEEKSSTKETSTKSYTTPDYDIQQKVPPLCMNSTCDVNDLFIYTSEERIKIPEGINFTLTCMSNNHSYNNMLYFYKNNESEYFLQTLGSNAQLHLNVPDTKLIHSGTYVCVKWANKHSCCNTKLELIIYEVPLYQYHLIIISLVTLVSLLLCIFLSVRKSLKLKKYTKEFTEKHGKLKNLL